MSEPTELHLERVQATVRRLRVRIVEGPDRDRVMEHYGDRLGIGTSPANELTLTDPAPNVFRFVLDAAQYAAGLGNYAYRQLGWRTAATA